MTGGSPRYRLYPTADGRFVAAAPLEDRFWAVFAEAIGLEETYRDDAVDPAATALRVSEIVRAESAAHWESAFAKADCCATVVKTVEEALADPCFRARGLFDAGLANEEGDEIAALPVPIAPQFRVARSKVLSAPAPGADNGEI